MDRGLAVAMTAGVGGLIAMQAPINSVLGKTIGTWQGAFFSFVSGTIVLAVIVAFAKGGFSTISGAKTLNWYYLIGGLFGLAYVATVLVTVRTLGAGGVTAATIAGQLVMSLVIDQLGLFGVNRDPITAIKVFGVALLASGTFLIIRG